MSGSKHKSKSNIASIHITNNLLLPRPLRTPTLSSPLPSPTVPNSASTSHPGLLFRLYP